MVGVDLTSAFSRDPRPVDIATIADSTVSFSQWNWPRGQVVREDAVALSGAFCAAVGWNAEETVLAIDGPQALAREDPMRQCELQLGTPGRTPAYQPHDLAQPFHGYILSSLLPFRALLRREKRDFHLAGYDNVQPSTANLFEAFPGAEWSVLLGRRVPRKASSEGRRLRSALWDALGLRLPEGLPTPDQNDALICACLAMWARTGSLEVALVGEAPYRDRDETLREGYILHACQELDICTAGPPAAQEVPNEPDWADDGLLLALTDTGLVHGGVAENRWLEPGRDYELRTREPWAGIEFHLTYSREFPGGRGWTCTPTVGGLLSEHLHVVLRERLSEHNKITLRVELVAP